MVFVSRLLLGVIGGIRCMTLVILRILFWALALGRGEVGVGVE
jgi:hypothetical protein